MTEEKRNEELVQMYRDLGEIFGEEYERRRLITPQNTAEKMTAKGYRKQVEGEWGFDCRYGYFCTNCGEEAEEDETTPYCPFCGARMKGGE